MHTARLETVRAVVSVATMSLRGGGGGRSTNEQVWTGLHWSRPDSTSAGGGGPRSPGLMSGRRVPSHVTYPMVYLMLHTPSPCGQTDVCENITGPKLRLRAVIIFSISCNLIRFNRVGIFFQSCHQDCTISTSVLANWTFPSDTYAAVCSTFIHRIQKFWLQTAGKPGSS